MADEYRPRCVNLLCKSMLVYGEDFEQDPEFEANGDFWCICTSKNRGPDGDTVSLASCRDATRSCFQEF